MGVPEAQGAPRFSDARRIRLEDVERKLSEQRAAYERAQAEIASKAWVEEAGKALDELATLMAQFRPGDAGEKAIYLLGQCSQVVRRVRMAEEMVNAYETLREQARKLRDGLGEK
jgi:hypothetical protein